MLYTRGIALALTLALSGSLAAQSLGEVAAKEKKRREAQEGAAKDDKSEAKTFTDEDLQKYAGETPNGTSAARPAGEDSGATATEASTSAATPVVKRPGEEVKRLQAAAIKTDLVRCQVRLAAAREHTARVGSLGFARREGGRQGGDDALG